jgi:hypothetical protein
MKIENSSKTLSVEYHFKLLSGAESCFLIELDEETLQLRQARRETLPDWTLLTRHQCPNCPLDPAGHAHCPAAVSLVELVKTFRDADSYELADVRVHSMNRDFSKRTPLQYGVSSLMGLLMVTSGCPVLDKLRPLAHTHMPFTSAQETVYRLCSMFLLGQYFIQQEGGTPDWSLKKMAEMFEGISLVNRSFGERLLEVSRSSDAVNNALANLDCMALLTTFSVKSDLNRIKKVFLAWHKDATNTDGRIESPETR